ncbi:glucose-1-phosphate adenylyltransferase [Metabacillus sediminilitoris]|uniref:Glucose-1-phosphate adenylyltransferase n=1 Tax=Metabacillus sediminilitoris TaxID=2567941 RepID=A0A4S4BPJ3_9BACI|nr:glucose-1-phosphate adenylyltransferase [Metabacillus sediminilitoris]QGQ47725.1 glucose-1-phosphate adenylyltransferase [Metabacillus sediminilitoris]THF76830.1 glucose-1-phosphate adenylyltransferase [Metabacillus sediminilitoris]
MISGGTILKKQCIAMLLAGGRGTRLKNLTENLAKPAVPFGGKYRIIDFTLSNCRNSGIDTVGVLTQYQPHILQSYISDGKDWDLNRRDGGISILPPYQCENGERWYEGTAHAIYQNMHIIEQYAPEHVLVISGDHIYKMDYNKMLQHHIDTNADATISVIEVPWKEASRFGLLKTDEYNDRIVDFEEKPKNPSSNLASMGIYIFKWKTLKAYLEQDQQNPFSTKDFGKDIIPTMLQDNLKLFAYRFNGYWKDVGTISSYWEANMDLLKKETNILLNDKEWGIYTVEQTHPPQYLDSNAKVTQSLISEGCEIYGTVEKSVLFSGVKIGNGSIIKDSVILPGAVIGDNVIIEKAVVAPGVTIGDGVSITSKTPANEITLVSENLQQNNFVYQVI